MLTFSITISICVPQSWLHNHLRRGGCLFRAKHSRRIDKLLDAIKIGRVAVTLQRRHQRHKGVGRLGVRRRSGHGRRAAACGAGRGLGRSEIGFGCRRDDLLDNARNRKLNWLLLVVMRLVIKLPANECALATENCRWQILE